MSSRLYLEYIDRLQQWRDRWRRDAAIDEERAQLGQWLRDELCRASADDLQAFWDTWRASVGPTHLRTDLAPLEDRSRAVRYRDDVPESVQHAKVYLYRCGQYGVVERAAQRGASKATVAPWEEAVAAADAEIAAVYTQQDIDAEHLRQQWERGPDEQAKTSRQCLDLDERLARDLWVEAQERWYRVEGWRGKIYVLRETNDPEYWWMSDETGKTARVGWSEVYYAIREIA